MKKIFKSIYTKYLLGYVIFISMCLVYISLTYEAMVLEKQISSSAIYMYNQANGISDFYSKNAYNLSDKNFNYNASMKSFMLPEDFTLWIVDIHGTILYSSSPRDVGGNIGEFTDYFDNKFYTTTKYDNILPEEVLSVYSSITNNYKTYGYIIMNQRIDTIKGSITPLRNYAYSNFLIMTIFSLIFIIIFHIFYYRPTKKIKKAVNEYAKGNFNYEGANIHSKDELYDISEKLKFIAKEMRETDKVQKNFIANISHDFRSPLTSIKGYIEAMLDGTIPPELHEKYLKILLFETERLNKLTSSLLQLNTWDVKGTKLDITEFDIVPLTRNIVATFQGQCQEKKITLDVVFGNKSYPVMADQLKIQQVIYNLLDNAIKFSHNNSVIHINITDKNDKLFVSIKDNGIGIPKENLNKIWDRFYKTDLSRGKDKTGSGLGLSIVKEIITSHNENIDVISTEGIGTEFIFTLQKAKRNLLPIVSS